MVCIYCQKEFEPSKYRRTKQRACGDPACQKKRQRDNLVAWQDRNPLYYRIKRMDSGWRAKARHRAKRWRTAHKDRIQAYRVATMGQYRVYMREYMRRYRAAQRAQSSSGGAMVEQPKRSPI